MAKEGKGLILSSEQKGAVYDDNEMNGLLGHGRVTLLLQVNLSIAE